MIVESLGAIPKLDTETVQRVLGFVFNGLNPAMKGDRDHKVRLNCVCAGCECYLSQSIISEDHVLNE